MILDRQTKVLILLLYCFSSTGRQVVGAIVAVVEASLCFLRFDGNDQGEREAIDALNII